METIMSDPQLHHDLLLAGASAFRGLWSKHCAIQSAAAISCFSHHIVFVAGMDLCALQAQVLYGFCIVVYFLFASHSAAVASSLRPMLRPCGSEYQLSGRVCSP